MLIRGSRKHVLDLLDSGNVEASLSKILAPYGIAVPEDTPRRPIGHAAPEERTVRCFCSKYLASQFDFARFDAWWLPDKYTNPQWDLLAVCTIQDNPGLLLVEAKANDRELDWKGKPLAATASRQSRANHHAIAACIEEANTGLNALLPGFALTIDSHYQLCNRLAMAWKLAQCGLPVALLYLGFTGDRGIQNVGTPLVNHDHWQRLMGAYLYGVAPLLLPGTPLCPEGGSTMHFLTATLPAQNNSPSPEKAP